ncbi:RpoD/SigA family RNA polymerase sigma factor [Komarekiella sp. 'clone 1']|uniref:RpoD/SigA family RNA polymerase sigma factor n=1 Tax=Komarekiella delphini-convector SJRDD-AB1 TaxID=2593771 RepID=A0AA40T4X7_9NOST|nr:RpoD/SigA family RNA polymerase sigma factor [Komarekiella delphini-convector]MBD6620707.1 RpoD/SigA family RNA polymerase sigma factor [Komarekiella delphini-convector SJRDD-AB1]
MSLHTSDLVRIYLQEIGRFPLLTPEQEMVYARQVQQMMVIAQARTMLTKQLHREPTSDELAADINKTEAEVAQILKLGHRAKQKMVTANLRLVVSVAKKYQNRSMEFLDLLQEGSLGLQRGIEKFDPNRGYKLSTYAYWWIVQSITRAIAQTSRTIRLPIYINEKLNKIKKVQRELSQTLGRRSTITEIALALNESPNQIWEYISVSRQPVSLFQSVGENQNTALGELLQDESVSLDEHITQECLRQDMINVLSLLTPIQREVIILRFGLDSDRELTLAEIGKRLDLSRERVRQIQVKAMNIMRHSQHDLKQHLMG